MLVNSNIQREAVISPIPIERYQKPRLHYIDNLRVLACFLVLLTHSAMSATNPQAEGFWLFALSFMGSPSSELFLALSGTVLLPVKTGMKQFYRRRFRKLIPPLVVWSVLGVILYTQTHNLPWSEAWNKILHIPLQPAIGIYWFIYAMGGLYLFAPYISPWLKAASRRQLELFLCLWLVNMALPWLEFFSPGFLPGFRADGNYYWTLCYFGGFLGYWLLGYYLNNYPVRIGWNFKWVSLIACVIAYPLVILIVKLKDGDTGILTDNLQIGSAALVAILYTVMQHIKFNAAIQRVLTAIAKYSFGIYLTHIYIARELYWGIFEGSTIHIFPRTFLIALMTLLTGYAITKLLSMLPNGKYITGA